ncbi:hypothetical protein A3Q56_04002, partial [Intoshia linei]
ILYFHRKNVTETDLMIDNLINVAKSVNTIDGVKNAYAMLSNIKNIYNQTIEIETSLISAKIETINPTLKNYESNVKLKDSNAKISLNLRKQKKIENLTVALKIIKAINNSNPIMEFNAYIYWKYKFYGNISLSLGSNLELFHINKFIIIDHYNTVERLIKYDKLKFIILPDDIKKIFFDEDVNIVQLSVSVMFYIQNFTDSKIPYNICFDLYIMDVSGNSYDLDRKLFHLTRNNQNIIQVGTNTTKSLLECIV